MNFLQRLEGWIWTMIGKLPNVPDPWNLTEEHPDDKEQRR
jgi:hypothetical protein